MSETKFNVGQWVTVHGGVNRIEEVGSHHVRLDDGFSINLEHVTPFVWQVGKTYKTTLDGVTAKVDAIVGGRILVLCDWRHPTEQIQAAAFNVVTGRLTQFETRSDVPHLLPYLADELPPVADAATFSEFAEADECDDSSAWERLRDEFKSRRERYALIVPADVRCRHRSMRAAHRPHDRRPCRCHAAVQRSWRR